ncbi:uncharacterized protein LOC144635213 isoform X3 [Oculina patagonica]
MHASTKGSFINETLEDDEATSVGTKPSEQEKLERNTAEKETGRANVAQGSNRALLALVITMCLISLVVLLLTLLMLFGKIGDGCGCSTDEASSISDKSHATNTAKIKTLEENITSLQLGLMEHLDDLAELNNTVIKTEAGYNALRDDLNMTRSELLLITGNITLTTRFEYLDAVLTRLKSALNRTNTDLARLKSTQTKEKVIYHQTMTPSWLVAHASYINSYRLNTTEQLAFTDGPSEDEAALLKVPMIPANVLHNSTQLTVKIVVSNDVDIASGEDSDIRYGVSDGISFVGFQILSKENYEEYANCYGVEGSSGTTLTGRRYINYYWTSPSDSFYPGQFVITLKLDAHENWGSCYSAHEGGFVKTAGYNNRLVLSNGLSLEVYKDDKEERSGINFIEVTVVEDV